MSKKFYIGICCLALLATSVASAYSEDFEGYTGNAGDQWSLTPEFNASGWTTLYRDTSNRGDIANWDLAAGYNSAQGLEPSAQATGAHLLDDPQGPNGTFVYTAMIYTVDSGVMMFAGTDELMAPESPGLRGWLGLTIWGSSVTLDAYIDGNYASSGWDPIGMNFYTVGWAEAKIEIDTNASSRPTVLRFYSRDLADDGSGPTTAWDQANMGGTGGGVDLTQSGADWELEAFGFRCDGPGVDVAFDNLVATSPLPGDVDCDGVIDNDDLNIILANWGKSGQGWAGGDLNGNGIVDGPDYAEVLSYWAPAEPPKTAGVPEPVTLAILGAGGLLALFRRRKA